VTILAITRNPEEWKALDDIAERERWTLLWAQDADRAYELISRHRIRIVICDRQVNGEDWRSVVARFAGIQPPVCTLLASEVADEFLWREVVHNKGFEILTKPFDPEKVVRTVRLASLVLPSLTDNSFAHRVKN
jgi:DNA-binding response OmpR family regulator